MVLPFYIKISHVVWCDSPFINWLGKILNIFRDRDAKCIEGSLRLSDSPDLIAAGQVGSTLQTPSNYLGSIAASKH